MTERVYGVTPPISTALPTEGEKRLHQALHEELRAQGTFESRAETESRKKVIAQLEKITTAFVKKATAETQNSFMVREAIGRVFTYGSYRLGVYGPGSDIDTLVVAPKHVTTEQYFRIFPDLLVEMAPPGAITDLTPVPDAFVPIIKFEFDGISIDLIFCSIKGLTQIPEDKSWNLTDNTLLRGLSENEVRSLNGTRVTDEILNLVPEPATFKLALRAIKLWAQRKAIYANIMGFPGGVAWAMLVARVCQLYPKATSAVVVNKFFHIMLKWPWPLPVLLKDIEYNISVTRAPVWNPKLYSSDRNHRMPIITPAYPAMCATHNVNRSSKVVIMQELEKGVQVTEDIMTGRAPWKALFTKHTFFTSDFRYYLTVISSSRTKDAQNVWSGFVESRVRVLVNKIENHPAIVLARPFNKGYDRQHRCKKIEQLAEVVDKGSLAYLYKPTPEEEKANSGVKPEVKAELINAELKPESVSQDGQIKSEPGTETAAPPSVTAEDGAIIKPEPGTESAMPPPAPPPPATVPEPAPKNVDSIKSEDSVKKEEATKNGNGPEHTDGDKAEVKLSDMPEKKEQELEVFTTNYYVGLQLGKAPASLDLSREVQEWMAMCRSSDLFKDGVNFLAVTHIKNTMLPDDVFEPGEARPRPPKKKLKRQAPGDESAAQQPAKKSRAVDGAQAAAAAS
ncbi:Poly(A) polymerase central domain-containing protein [Triangularia verruculosa]|uniref:Poly(A) polymerase n=1 Tax=Triangularia verruculosa TaxID=2587418 RepID=A0AAN7B0Y3_9PEZI|nr:Poly(A) polymerase central domain-containing protein [Triangularia verruculosa]